LFSRKQFDLNGEEKNVNYLLKSLYLLAVLVTASTPAVAQNIMGPSQIISVTTTITSSSGYPLSQIADGISANPTFNGFAGDANAIGTITFTFDKPYDLDQSYLWNDINVQAEGVKTYKFNFFDSSNTLIGTTAIFSVTTGQIPAHIEGISVDDVKTVEMVVISIQGQAQLKRVEIREVAFNGIPTLPPVDVPGEHEQCYRVIQGKKLAPTKIKVADQFGKTEIVLGMPVMLCNPSAKFHNGMMYEPINPQLHKVCYQIVNRLRPQRARKVRISNQFTTKEMTVVTREMFCVPSHKTLLNEIPYNISDFTENP
jgi:hypothetical protein